MPGMWFEEFEEGQEFKHPWSRTVTEMDNVLFTSITMNPAPLHLDAEYMKHNHPTGQRLMNSLYTAGLIGGMIVYDLTMGTTLGNLGYTKFDFPKPVFHGDTLRAETTILGKRESKSRTDSGIVTFEHRGYNQRDEVVHIAHRAGLMLKRPVDA
ncbi:MaoC family dehydratase [Nocardioides daphniae]|uniref:MaoC family dehydratase n=1 Tax=Nocardioides daphniae TaxID=402297 RepID=A0A4P7UA11_9ACTN|nr:MaoC family dehydratase [Nocardioides daphniae]QCC76441.1 MaoC family dehydratase [Nocardioides daphniae]GGD06711.1 MaoC family dehydratase [Nocardioides daphniae]